MSQALAQQSDQASIKQLLNSDAMKRQFALALPRHLSPDRFIRVATTALMRTPALAECTPESFMKCMLELSAWGIEPDGRRAHLIPFKNHQKKTTECTLILDWKGLAELAQRSGEIAKLHADLICDNDDFAYNLGTIERHRIDFRQNRGAPYAAYAMAVTKDGATYVAVMTRDEILSVRDGSQGWQSFKKGYAKQSPWDPENPVSEGEMWKKTAFRRLSKWLPLSPEFRDAVEKDDDDSTIDVRTVVAQEFQANALAGALTSSPDKTLPPADGGPRKARATRESKPAPETTTEAPAETQQPDDGKRGTLAYFERMDRKELSGGKVKFTLHYQVPGGPSREADTFSKTFADTVSNVAEGQPIRVETTPNKDARYADTLVFLELETTEGGEGPWA